MGRREREHPRLPLGLGCVCRKYQGQAAEDTCDHSQKEVPTHCPPLLTYM